MWKDEGAKVLLCCSAVWELCAPPLLYLAQELRVTQPMGTGVSPPLLIWSCGIIKQELQWESDLLSYSEPQVSRPKCGANDPP